MKVLDLSVVKFSVVFDINNCITLTNGKDSNKKKNFGDSGLPSH